MYWHIIQAYKKEMLLINPNTTLPTQRDITLKFSDSKRNSHYNPEILLLIKRFFQIKQLETPLIIGKPRFKYSYEPNYIIEKKFPIHLDKKLYKKLELSYQILLLKTNLTINRLTMK